MSEDEQIGQFRISLNAMWRRLLDFEERLRILEGKPVKMTGRIEGLEGEWTITPPPEWEG